MQRRRRGVLRLWMTPQSRCSVGIGLLFGGLLLWGIAAALLHDLLARPLGVVMGGALTALGIIFLATSH